MKICKCGGKMKLVETKNDFYSDYRFICDNCKMRYVVTLEEYVEIAKLIIKED